MLTTVQIEKLIESTVRGLGCELWGCELSQQGGRSLLRIYVDSEDGVTVDTCAKLSRQIGALLDVEDLIRGRYILEVSSPGIERPLFRLSQYQRLVGKEVKIRLRLPKDERRNFSGVLDRVENDVIVLRTDQQTYKFAFNDIEKGNLIAALR